MATKVGSVHHEAVFTEQDTVAELQRMVRHAECPVKETYNTCSLVLSALAREHGVKAILTGEGPTNSSAGNPGTGSTRAGAARWCRAIRWRTPRGRPSRPAVGRPGALLRAPVPRVAGREVRALLRAGPGRLRGVRCLHHPVVDHERLVGRPRHSQRSYLDFTLRLSDHLLTDHGDRMALANSVEARFPFLDRAVLDFATQIPNRSRWARGSRSSC